jgi:MSHA biogenesis protein MshL
MKRQLLAAFAIPLGVAGCVNPSASRFKDTKALPAYTVPAQSQKQTPSSKDPDAYRYSDSGRAYSLTLKNADLRDVLILLSKESGVSIVAERGLRGTVQIEAKNKKLGELLYTILKPLGYTASVENGMILVGRPKLSTRTFRMNYLKDTRNSSSNMNVSGFTTGGGGSVSVSTNGKSDYWGAIESSLELFVFGTTGKGRRESGGYIVGETEKKPAADSKTVGQGTTDKKFTATEPDDPMLSSTQLNENQLKQLVVNEMAGIIQITDFPENLDKIASFLTDVEEGSKRQVLIQAHIMEVNLSDSYAMGIDWKTIINKSSNFSIAQTIVPTTSGAASAGSNVFKISAVGDSFGVMLDAMKEQGNVNMLSSPKISALNNQKAVIKLTTKEVSWVSTKTTSNVSNGSDTFTTTPQIDEVGIFLDVTPQIGLDGSVVMQIHPSVSEIREISTSPDKSSTKPVVDVREIDTMVDAKAGETIVIAGLISDKLLEAKRGVPLLGDIPYLGALFSYNKQTRTKSELVIMMTPYFLNAKSIDDIRRDHEKRMQNIGGDFHLINNLGSMVTEKSSRDWIMRSEPNRVPPASADGETPAKREVDSPAPNPAAVPAPPQSRAVTPPQETVKPIVVTERITVTPPETLQQLEQQQTMIERLKADVTAAEERLKRERLENEAKNAEERRLADAARQAQLKRIEELQNSTTNQTASVPPPLPLQPKPEEPRQPVAAVQTVSVTTDREQTLYRSAVTAYKIGDCAESIKNFDAFAQAYPQSPFLSDAAYYRKDCADRLAGSNK